MFDIQEEIKKIPTNAGVYLMFDENDNIIYIGKAKILKNRLRQYFTHKLHQEVGRLDYKVYSMVKNIKKFEYIVTKNEIDALILENNLIKKHKPKYNILLKDDKTYPYVKITINDIYPKLFITREYKKDGSKYFGPYTNAISLKENMRFINDILKLRTCSLKFPKDFFKERPCLNYYIGKCEAPCHKKITEEFYSKNIQKAIDFFNGKYKEILRILQDEMMSLSENLEFEKAIDIREKIKYINELNEKQIVENLGLDDKDVIGFVKNEKEVMFYMFFVRGGKISGQEKFLINNLEHIPKNELLTNFIKSFYGGTAYIPKYILVQEEVIDAKIIEEYLSSIKEQKVNIIIPKKGEKYKLIQMALDNALIALDKFAEQIKKENQRTIGAIEEIRQILNIDTYLKRIEAYDISNTQGTNSVGSMIVFENGKPFRTDYRKFKIKTVIGANDCLSLKEVIERRFKNYIRENSENIPNKKFSKLPSILFIDGGKPQVNAVKEILDELGIDIEICGMVKDDRHRTRGLFYEGIEILFNQNSQAFKLVTRIQDEVHRFALDYHKKLRQKSVIKSVLDKIDGVGSVRKKELLKHFGSLEKIKNASVNEIANISGLNITTAQNIYRFFNK